MLGGLDQEYGARVAVNPSPSHLLGFRLSLGLMLGLRQRLEQGLGLSLGLVHRVRAMVRLGTS